MKLVSIFKKLCSYILGYFIVTFIVFEIFSVTNLIDNNIFSKIAFTSYFLILLIYFMIKNIYNYTHDKPVKLALIYKLFSVQMSLIDAYDQDIDVNFYNYAVRNEKDEATRKRIIQSANNYINCKFNIIAYIISILFIIEIIFYEKMNNWILFGTLALYFLAYIYLFFSKRKK